MPNNEMPFEGNNQNIGTYQNMNSNLNMDYEPIMDNDSNMDNEMMEEGIELPKVVVVDQPYINKFPLDEALKKGTLFPNLYDPYMVRNKSLFIKEAKK